MKFLKIGLLFTILFLSGCGNSDNGDFTSIDNNDSIDNGIIVGATPYTLVEKTVAQWMLGQAGASAGGQLTKQGLGYVLPLIGVSTVDLQLDDIKKQIEKEFEIVESKLNDISNKLDKVISEIVKEQTKFNYQWSDPHELIEYTINRFTEYKHIVQNIDINDLKVDIFF